MDLVKKKVYKAIITLISISASINWYGLPRGAVQSPPLEIFKTQLGKNPEQPAHIHPSFTVAMEGGHGTKRSPAILPPQPFCDSAINKPLNLQEEARHKQ